SDLTSRRTGLQLGLAAVTEANTGDIAVKLKPKHEHSSEEVIADLRVKIKQQEPELDTEFPQLLQDMIGDLTSAPEPVVIKLFSHFFFSSKRQHTSSYGDWSSDVCSSDLGVSANASKTKPAKLLAVLKPAKSICVLPWRLSDLVSQSGGRRRCLQPLMS